MKKVFLMLCLLGIALPYYQLLLFIQGDGSMAQFWTQAFGSYPASMLAMDLSVAALSFLIFLIYQRVQKRINLSQFIKYFISTKTQLTNPEINTFYIDWVRVWEPN